MESEKAGGVLNFRELVVWQKGISLAKEIYTLTGAFPQQESFGLVSQMRRAAVSIPSNIAEGQVRQHKPDFVRFLYISLGSLAEIETQIILSQELGYLQAPKAEKVMPLILEIRKMLYGLIKSLPNR